MKFSFFNKKGKSMTEQNINSEEEVMNEAVAEETTPPTYEELQAQIVELEGRLKDEELRGLANEQNLRRRHQEEILATHKFAGQKFAAEMLVIKDYLEMAMLDQSGNFEALKMGVQMTLNEVNKAFDATQIKEINPQIGSKLDPHQHQAMQTEESNEEPNTILRVLKKGYLMSERVLRPAMVVVAKAHEESTTSSTDNAE